MEVAQLHYKQFMAEGKNAEKTENARANDRTSHETLRKLLKKPCNKECADCLARNPGWAALPHGVFICIDCAQVHRHIGRHISQTKAINTGTYLWYPEEVAVMLQVGNDVARQIYLGRDLSHPKPEKDAPREMKEEYIRDKYERKRWWRSADAVASSVATGAQVDTAEKIVLKLPTANIKRNLTSKAKPRIVAKTKIDLTRDLISFEAEPVPSQGPTSVSPECAENEKQARSVSCQYQNKKNEIMDMYNQPNFTPASALVANPKHPLGRPESSILQSRQTQSCSTPLMSTPHNIMANYDSCSFFKAFNV
ncbi:hypothetical protein CYMTET_22340 [Cymbomonas tetramitiformis]|uniref:Arf-GAP domain-containing protein n=1 Tax=Cymbomonas tetramitiformis TaxID=36881 RepID=A0AAE0G075_9CHLO|nr:hypothetical protein CYMTET_22340 [Cymbomonas tetramitiformis]|eukprot:gene6901-8236_t